MQYWRLYEVTEQELRKNRVYPVDELYVNKKRIWNKNNDLQFAYLETFEDNDYMKIYTPFSTQMKWLSNIPLSVPFGLSDLPYKSKRIIITKSKKDLIILKKFFTDVIATQNESESALTEELQAHLHEKYDERIIIWDNDPTGVENCTLFNDKGFGYWNVPKAEYLRFKIKDVSDYVKYYGIDALEALFQQKGLLCPQ